LRGRRRGEGGLGRFGRRETGFGDDLGVNGRLVPSRLIDVTAGLGLARGGFQGALPGGEFALGKVKISGPAGAAGPRWILRRALAAADLTRRGRISSLAA
jgi:hypothetical protein